MIFVRRLRRNIVSVQSWWDLGRRYRRASAMPACLWVFFSRVFIWQYVLEGPCDRTAEAVVGIGGLGHEVIVNSHQHGQLRDLFV